MNNSSIIFLLGKPLFIMNRGIISLIKELFLILLVFSYLFPFWLKGFPFATNRLLQILGILSFLAYLIQSNSLSFNKKLRSTFLFCFLLTFGALIALLTPQTTDYYIVKYMFEMNFYIISSYFVIQTLNYFKPRFSLTILLDYIVLATLLQAVISFIFLFNAPIYYLFISFLNDEVGQELTSGTGKLEVRLLGISNSFFTGVFNYGVVFLITCALPFLKGSIIYKRRLFYWTTLVIIAAAGFLTGRSFIIAILLGLFFVLYLNRKKLSNYVSKGFKVSILIALLIFAFSYLFQSLIDTERLDQIYNWVFELFINFSETGEFESRSSNAIIEMYRFPQQLKTWLIGDGLFYAANGTSYYKNIDVGFIRLIYYFGLPLTILYYFIQLKYATIGASFYKSIEIRTLIFYIFLYVLILNLKGLLNGDKYFILFIMYGILFQRKISAAK